MVIAGPWLVAAMALAACGPSQTGDTSKADVEARNFANEMAGVEKPAPPAQPFEKSETSEFLEFVYAYPAQAAAIPFLVRKFERAMTSGRADALRMARADSAAAKKADYPFHAHSLETRWSVEADTPRFLSLQSSTYVFTGGAHGMTGYDALLWDKERKRETSFGAVMTSKAAFAEAIDKRFCAALDSARAEKRGAPVVPGDDEFTKCIDPMEQVLVPTSKDGKLIDGVTVVIGPYSAGPYAEGSYDIALPVDAAMREAIKAEYQDAFVVPGS